MFWKCRKSNHFFSPSRKNSGLRFFCRTKGPRALKSPSPPKIKNYLLIIFLIILAIMQLQMFVNRSQSLKFLRAYRALILVCSFDGLHFGMHPFVAIQMMLWNESQIALIAAMFYSIVFNCHVMVQHFGCKELKKLKCEHTKNLIKLTSRLHWLQKNLTTKLPSWWALCLAAR